MRILEALEDLQRLPEAFGSRAYRARRKDGGRPVILLVLPGACLETLSLWDQARTALSRPETEGSLLSLEESGVEAEDTWAIFRDPGGPLLADELDRSEGSGEALALLEGLSPFLDAWDQLGTQKMGFDVMDPRRLLLGPKGWQSFDPVHLRRWEPGQEACGPSFAGAGDLRVLSPEGTRRTALTVDTRSGLFSLGALLYRLGSGAWAFDRPDQLEMVHALLTLNPDLNRPGLLRLGPVFQAVTGKLLNKQPGDRYQTLRGLKWDLGQRGLSLHENFVPGQHDRAQSIAELRGFYGRREELTRGLTLIDATRRRQGACWLLEAPAGQGKSRLLEELRRRSPGALWLQGKFELRQARFSAGALVQTLQQAAQLLDTETGEGGESPAGALLQRLGEEAGRNRRVLTRLSPELEALWGPGPELGELPPEEAQKRLAQVLTTFFRGLAADRAPVVLVLEDLHNADAGSLRILQAWAEQPLPGLCLLLTARPEEAVLSALRPWLARLPEGQGGLTQLRPLEESDLEALLSEVTELEPDPARQLAQRLFRHSGGNPFFLRELLREMNLRQALVFDEGASRWSLRLESLENLPYQEGLLDLLRRRLEGLSRDVRQSLTAAALIGPRFSRDEVLAAAELPVERFEQLVEELLDLGVWDRLSPREFRFTHDHIQETVLTSASAETQADLSLALGRSRLKRWRQARRGLSGSTPEAASTPPAALTPSSALTPGAFPAAWAALPLNLVRQRLEPSELADLRVLNREAGDEARQNSDFSGALGFYKAALALADEAVWAQDPEGVAALALAAAETAYAAFDRAFGDRLCEDLVRRSPSALERARVRERQQTYMFYLGDFEASLDMGHRGLRELGLGLPEQPGLGAVVLNLLKVKLVLAGKSPAQLLAQERTEDPRTRTAMRLLTGFIPPAFLSGRQNLFGVAVLKATRLTARQGLCPEAAPSYTGYALLLAALGDLKGAYRTSRLALSLNEQLGDLTWRPMVQVLTGLFSLGWFEPWSRLKALFSQALGVSEDTGEVVYRTYAQLFATLWNPRETLPERLRSTEEALIRIQRTPYPLTRLSAFFVLGALKNLAAGEGDRLDFSQPGFDPEAALEENRRTQSRSGLATAYSAMLKPAVILGLLDQAEALMDQAWSSRIAIAGSLYEEELTLFSGLLCADLLRRGQGPLGARRRRLAQCRRQAEGWARLSPLFRTHASVLAAEEADLQDRPWPAQALFQAAVQAADEAALPLYQALTRERLARFARRRGQTLLAQTAWQAALDAYLSYGALRKAARLRQEAGLALRPEAVQSLRTPGLASGDAIDHLSLLRALETLTGDPSLEALLSNLAKLALENCGADRVLVFLAEGPAAKPTLALKVRAEGGRLETVSGQTWDTAPGLPRRLLEASLRDGRACILEEVGPEERLREPDLAERGVQALLGLPLAQNGTLRLYLYLENRVMPGILTQARLRVLEQISNAIILALQNARLYEELRRVNESLEQRVEERTREVHAAQKKVILQEKLASLGALTAGIAHELKNPLNLINNFSDSSRELMEELAGLLDTERQRFSPEAQKEIDYLVPELRQNMADIKHHGERGDAIIRSMLMHSRAGSGVTTREDLNDLVRESFQLAFHGLRATEPEFTCRRSEELDPDLAPLPMNRANLGRVFLNLFNNAFYAVYKRQRAEGTDLYQPEVKVSTESRPGELRILVEDNGIGIPPELHDKVFQPFFTTKPAGEGTGLGLSISYEIIRDEFGGSFELESEPGRFTRFTIRLPRSQA